MAKRRFGGKLQINPVDLVVIGGSAGSLGVISFLLSNLKRNFHTPIILVIHRKASSFSGLQEVFASKTFLKVKEVEEKEKICKGYIYIAPADYHLLVENNKTFSLDYSEKINFSRPSIDPTFETAADAYQDKLCCILLSGASADGVNGLIKAKQQRGRIIVQSPETAEVSYMPEQAILRANPDHICPPKEIVKFLNEIETE